MNPQIRLGPDVDTWPEALRNRYLERLKASRPPSRISRDYRPYGGASALWKLALEAREPQRLMLAGPSETGKTLAVLQLLDHLCWRHRDLQAVIVRARYADMPSTVLQTYEKKVLRMTDGSTADGITKYGGESPRFYSYPTGARVWVGGLDKPGKVLSSERDAVIVNQAEELSVADWETISTRTSGRAGVLKAALLIGDCNPGAPTHWIKGKASDGTLKLVESRHEDNPVLFDPLTKEITAQGKHSIAALDSLTGARKLRLRYGKWAAAEGVVFETYDAAVHRIKAAHGIKYHIASVDWGFTNPGVIQVWGIDGDKRMARVREIYRSKRTIDWWIGQALALRTQYSIRAFVCDPSEPGYIQQFKNAGLAAVPAFNDISIGINNLQQRFAVQPDGLPRLVLCEDAVTDRDEELAAAHKASCFEDELELYSWPKDASGHALKEIPVDEHNHACDAARYAAAHIDCLGHREVKRVSPFGLEQASGWAIR